MKRYNNLFEQVTDIENIKLAIRKASRRKKKRKSVQLVMSNIDLYAEEIQKMLVNKTFTPSPCIVQTIYDGARKKERTIYKPKFFPDQIVHWALMLQIGELLQKRMYYYSCASIKGKGTRLAFKEMTKAMQSKYTYCLKLDIHKFYPSIDKDIIKAKFRRAFKDDDILWLIDTIVDGHETQGTGLPIGNYTSQWFANFYLTDLDNFIKQELKIKHYIRYMDDMVIFHTNKRKLLQIEKVIEGFLIKEKLKIKPNWKIIRIKETFVDFLGFRFYKDHITLRKSNFLRIKRRAKKICKKKYISYLDACAMISYDGLIKQSDCFNYLNKYIYPCVSIKRCRKVVSHENRKQCKTDSSM